MPFVIKESDNIYLQSSSTTFKIVVIGKRMTCGSSVVILTRNDSSGSSMSSSIIETLKHTRILSREKVRERGLGI